MKEELIIAADFSKEGDCTILLIKDDEGRLHILDIKQEMKE